MNRHAVTNRFQAPAAAALLASLLLPVADEAAASAPDAFPPAVIVAAETVLEGPDGNSLLRWPVAIGSADDPAVDAINTALSYEAVAGEALGQTVANYAGTGRGIMASDFRIECDEGGILSLTISTEFYGAYPSTSLRHMNFDLVTGNLLEPADIFRGNRLQPLASMLDDSLRTRVEEAIASSLFEGGGIDPAIYSGCIFTSADLAEFTITPDCVVFHYDAGFPHAIEAAEPDGDIALGYPVLAPFIIPGGPLENLAGRGEDI